MKETHIETDKARFKQIVKGKIRKNLDGFINSEEMIGKKGGDLVRIPIHKINLPHFRHSNPDQGGQGEGEIGDPIGAGDPQEGDAGQAGNLPGRHMREVEITLEELAEIMGEELELPNIQPKGKKNIISTSYRYNTIHTSGPDSQIHKKRTIKNAMLRQISSGEFDVKNPVIIPVRQDFRYKAPKIIKTPEANAVIIYMMDVSGSMSEREKNIVRQETFWIDTWLQNQYQGIETRFIIHDAIAQEVNRDTFFTTNTTGGTMISSAYKLCWNIINKKYPVDEWNIYCFHFSDGDNWTKDDNNLCAEILAGKILPVVNMFGYGQIENSWGSGTFWEYLENNYDLEPFYENNSLILSYIKSSEYILESIKEFLGKGV